MKVTSRTKVYSTHVVAGVAEKEKQDLVCLRLVPLWVLLQTRYFLFSDITGFLIVLSIQHIHVCCHLCIVTPTTSSLLNGRQIIRILPLIQPCSKTTSDLINPSQFLFFLSSPFLCIRNMYLEWLLTSSCSDWSSHCSCKPYYKTTE